MEEKKVYVYDDEQFENFHCATFINRDDVKDVRTFVIHRSRDEKEAYYKFLTEETSGLIGFNNINYDYPLTHYFLITMNNHVQAGIDVSVQNLLELMHRESQRLVKEEYTAIPDWNTMIPQLDLFKIHHFDNKAKRTSLKAVEIAINHENVQDCPFNELHWVEEDEIEEILGYNYNDTIATFKFYELSKNMIDMRKMLTKTYGIPLLNANDPKIGQEIFGREIAKKKGIRYRTLRDQRTFRRSIDLGKCLVPIISFKNKEFQALHDFFKTTIIHTTYKPFEESVVYKGFKYDYGVGGIHGCIKSGVYESTETHMILDIDVAAYYPSLGIQFGFYPQHLGTTFTEVYKRLFNTRMEAKRTGDKAVNSGLKLALNGVYGKSNDKFSLFFDPMYTMRITVNGQLLLTMLCEQLVDTIEDITMIQTNTDGITVKIPRTEHEILMGICRGWEYKTKMILEYGEYSKMVIRDVNNYLAQTTDGVVKPKGCFEIIPLQNGAVGYNKNWSMRVVPKAIHAYYLEGIPVENFIRKHDNIYDFGIGFRARKDWQVVYNHIEGDQRVEDVQQKTIRYYMSKSGGSLIKRNIIDKRIISLEAGKTCKIFNQAYFVPMEEYDIDYGYYIMQANKIKSAVHDGQLELLM